MDEQNIGGLLGGNGGKIGKLKPREKWGRPWRENGWRTGGREGGTRGKVGINLWVE